MNKSLQRPEDIWRRASATFLITSCNNLFSDPTHNGGNKLDLLLCNCPEIIVNVDSSTPEQSKFPIDHYIVEFQIKLNFKRARKVNRKVFNYKLANFEGLRNCLANVQFENASSYDSDEYWLKWKDLFLKAVYNFIPVKPLKI